jgi:hypothetical protein
VELATSLEIAPLARRAVREDSQEVEEVMGVEVLSHPEDEEDFSTTDPTGLVTLETMKLSR